MSASDVGNNPTVYLVGGYTWLNKGDAALVIALVSVLREAIPGVSVVMCSTTPELDKKKFGPFGIEAIPYDFTFRIPLFVSDVIELWNRYVGWRLLNRNRPRGLKGAKRLSIPFLSAIQLLEFIVVATARTALAAVQRRYASNPQAPFAGKHHVARPVNPLANSRCIVFVPGGYLIAASSRARNWLPGIFPVFVARALGTPVFVSPASVGPFVGVANRLIARLALRIPKRIYIRERETLTYLKDIGAPMHKVRITTDVAFLLQPQPSPSASEFRQRVTGSGTIRVGVSLRRFSFAASDQPEVCRTNYIDSIRALVNRLTEEPNTAVWFVSQNFAEKEDLDFSRDLAQTAKNQEAIYYVDKDFAPGELQHIYGAFDIFIGVRMHANIFAMTQAVPTLAIAYQSKSVGIMKDLGLTPWVLDIYKMRADLLIAKTEQLIAQRLELRNHLQKEIIRARRDVKHALFELAGLIKATMV